MARTGTVSEQITDKSIKSEDLAGDLQLSGSTFITGSLEISSSDAILKGNKLYIRGDIEFSGSTISSWSDIESDNNNDNNDSINLEKKFFAGNQGSFGDGGSDNDIIRTNNAAFAIFTSSSNFTPDYYKFVLNDNGVWNTIQSGSQVGFVATGELTQNGFYRYLIIASSTSSLETHIDYCNVLIKDS